MTVESGAWGRGIEKEAGTPAFGGRGAARPRKAVQAMGEDQNGKAGPGLSPCRLHRYSRRLRGVEKKGDES